MSSDPFNFAAFSSSVGTWSLPLKKKNSKIAPIRDVKKVRKMGAVNELKWIPKSSDNPG